MKLLNVVGARPNLMKIAPLMDAYRSAGGFQPTLVHTGQHYDKNLSQLFFDDLGIPKPSINLGVGSGSHAVQTAAILEAFEPVVLSLEPDAVVVVGDVNGTLACALVAAKLNIPVVHIEAGLRSFDRQMPEEINRILTDSISDVLFCTEGSGVQNLREEGIPDDRVHLVGNLMIDSLRKHRDRAEESPILEDLAISSGAYALLTLHRPSNVDDPTVLSGILDALAEIQRELPIVFPVHPRTRGSLHRFGLEGRLDSCNSIIQTEPLGYLDFLKLMAHSALVLTDSGGIQEETTVLGIQCVTLRFNTERPVTVEVGTNRLVGNRPDSILAGMREAIASAGGPTGVPELWDGRAGDRITAILASSEL